MIGGVLERGGCEENDWQKFAIHWYVRFVLFQISRSNPQKSHNFAFSLPLYSFGVGGDWGIEGTTLQSV
jgi:hypothetical protein